MAQEELAVLEHDTTISNGNGATVLEAPSVFVFEQKIADEKIDIKENRIARLYPSLLNILLMDRTTNKNIIWATNDYKHLGSKYKFESNIEFDTITGENGEVIKPRVEKTKDEKKQRSKQRAEIFTPSWICNAQNNLVDEAWFGRANIFNIEKEKSWETVRAPVEFPHAQGKTWQDYIMGVRLEITCGEAPYLVSRYDTVTGEPIPLHDRIGLLDRKLRIVAENTDNVDDWIYWAIEAVKHIIGYEYQGDNVLLARENLLYTFIDYYEDKWEGRLPLTILEGVATIISWNIWQMDGLKQVVPNSCKPKEEDQLSLFTEDNKKDECIGCKTNNDFAHTGTYCKIMNWDEKQVIKFVDLLKGGKNE